MDRRSFARITVTSGLGALSFAGARPRNPLLSVQSEYSELVSVLEGLLSATTSQVETWNASAGGSWHIDKVNDEWVRLFFSDAKKQITVTRGQDVVIVSNQ